MGLYLNLLKHIVYNNLNWVPEPSICTFLITWRCELKCSMCSLPGMDDNGEMNTEQIKTVFSQLDCLDVVRITGGEPFVRNDLKEIVRHIIETSNPSAIILNTNGIQTQKIVEFARELGSSRFMFRVSLDAVGSKHDEIRGVEGAFEKTMSTLMEMVRLRERLGFSLGINMTIMKRNMDQIVALQELSRQLGVDLHYQIARDDRSLLEPRQKRVGPRELSFFDSFTRGELERIIEDIFKDSRGYNFKESLVKRYFHEGLKNRVLRGEKTPRPRCVSLTSHIRILPTGEVPICIHSNERIGDLTKQDYREIWFGEEIEPYRRMVRDCPGCWIRCEMAPSAIYTGDILRALVW
ncbi:MAG: radical SAM protein [Candidatus Brocadiales bacterium]